MPVKAAVCQDHSQGISGKTAPSASQAVWTCPEYGWLAFSVDISLVASQGSVSTTWMHAAAEGAMAAKHNCSWASLKMSKIVAITQPRFEDAADLLLAVQMLVQRHGASQASRSTCCRPPDQRHALPPLCTAATSIILLMRLLICRLDSPLCNITTSSLRSKNGLCCSRAVDGLHGESSSLPLLTEPDCRNPRCPPYILILANDFWLPKVCSARLLISLVLLEQANLPSVAM
ncbi:hypothetical protein BKA81DRAFT_378437 [Phyllosticta paracitricarpa]|uniref:Uncharacterized protein n=1 Tax=Phyllosticta citricarpa TaxID=55181 RepID=A0ABR1LMY6_9PEZI